GNPIRDRLKREAEIAATNWTQLADEWLAARARLAEKFDVTILPFTDTLRDLPPTAETVVINGTNPDQLARYNYSRMLWDMETVQPSGQLSGFVDKALKLLDLKQVMMEVETSVMSKVSCTACKAGAGLLQYYIKAGKSDEEIMNNIYQFCVSLNIQSARVCQGVTLLFGGEVIYVLKQVNMGPPQICSFVIGNACDDVYDPLHEWEVAFPPVNKPHVKPPIPPEEVGANAECNEPLCCRLTNGAPLSPAAGAGRWGDYRKCDTPKRTVEHMLKHIADTHSDIDYILWTGDIPPHDVWNQTREENLKILHETVAQLTEIFPGIPIFPALGNHESAPVNSFPPAFVPKENDISWLYDALDKHWRNWLPAGVSHTVRRGAFYSVLVRAEMNGEKVHIIGHIPPGHSDCLKVWSRNYYQIINRYESTIAAQFFGHTHYDEFQLFYDVADLGRAVSIAYVGPSVTPYYDLNPGYRIYYVDGDHPKTTRLVVDHETWVMNLKEANLYNYPIWHKMYSARQAYQMPSLLPKDWDSLIDKMSNEPSLFHLYYKHYYKNSPVRPMCNDECRKRLLCDLRSGRSHDRKALCQSLESRIDSETRTGWRVWIYNGLALSYVHNWWLQIYSGRKDINPSNLNFTNNSI
ncbi:Sphingomyelin phosphodiesterase, partial [Dufourea novaeangliae]